MNSQERFESLKARAEIAFAQQDNMPISFLVTQQTFIPNPMSVRVGVNEQTIRWKELFHIGSLQIDDLEHPFFFYAFKIDPRQPSVSEEFKQLLKEIGAWALSTGSILPMDTLNPLQIWCALIYITLIRGRVPIGEDFLSNPYFATVAALSCVRPEEPDMQPQKPVLTNQKKPVEIRSGKKPFTGADLKLIAGLSTHHNYNSPKGLNQEPIKSNTLAQQVGVCSSTASDFFKNKFGSHAQYVQQCKQIQMLEAALKMLNGDMTPSILSNRANQRGDILRHVPAPDEEGELSE